MEDIKAEVLPLHVDKLPHNVTASAVVEYFTAIGGSIKYCRIRRNNTAIVKLVVDSKVEQVARLRSLVNIVKNGEVYLLKINDHRDVSVRLDRKAKPDAEFWQDYENDDKIPLQSIKMGSLIDSGTLAQEVELEGLSIAFNFEEYQQIDVEFQIEERRYKMRFALNIVYQELRFERLADDGNQVIYQLIVSLDYPPLAWYDPQDGSAYEYKRSGVNWRRMASNSVNGIPLDPTVFYDRFLDDEDPKVFEDFPEIGSWLDHIYTFKFPKSSNSERLFVDFVTQLDKFGMIRKIPRGETSIQTKRLPPRTLGFMTDPHLSFNIKFQLLVLLSHNRITEHNITDEVVELLKHYPESISEAALEAMFNQKNKKRLWAFDSLLKRQLQETKNRKRKHKKELDINFFLSRKLVVTPTKVYYKGPFVEVSNRVTRNYDIHQQNFVRVTFCDDDFRPIGGKDESQAAPIFQRIRTILARGLYIENRVFEFLLYSNSQMRTAGCWFFANTDDLTGDEIRSRMGTFFQTKNPAKLGARMAQLFSATTVTGKLTNVTTIPDVERIASDGRMYCFSDGVGRIGSAIATNVMRRLRRNRLPSAFQFRMAGCKGVINNDIAASEAQIRPSQIKFQSAHLSLEIIRTSFFSPGYLNHQFIILLESLGVPKQTFVELKDEMVEDLEKIIVDINAAKRFLEQTSENDGLPSILTLLINAGFFEIREPFLINLLKLIKATMLKDLKRRGKIFVKKSAQLLGVMDEDNVLPEDCIFVQIRNPANGNNLEVLTGPILISRSPSIHPGDIRIVQAVDIEKLRCLEDVVVFSQKGDRPLPSMLSGGDLDGDTYFVCWDTRLYFPKNFEPMVFDVQDELTLDGEEISVEHIKEHFVKYMQQNNLGQIANAWKVWADYSDEGALDSRCIRLAELHSWAVDFPKKGIPAIMDKDLRPTVYPDFMEKGDRPSYSSKKAVGEIYRSVKVDLNIDKDIQPLPQLKVNGMEAYLQDAVNLKWEHDQAIEKFKSQFGVTSELELFSGFFFKVNDDLQKSCVELKQQARDSMGDLRKQFRDAFFSGFWPTTELRDSANSFKASLRDGYYVDLGNTCPLHVRQKAAAWYYVNYNIASLPSRQDLTPTSPTPTSSSSTTLYASDLELDESYQEIKKSELLKPQLCNQEFTGLQETLVMLETTKNMSFAWVMFDILAAVMKRAPKNGGGARKVVDITMA
ncbi:hypothetical protein HDV05_004488 [Chytridiales sp. JEL 0842]|nr:hypothetical protein HDV05_004488 [Chytridiales sp. JEL 0842]